MKNKIWNIIRIISILLNIGLSSYLIKIINDLSIIPNKYFTLGIIILVILNIVSTVLLIGNKLLTKILGIILSIIIITTS